MSDTVASSFELGSAPGDFDDLLDESVIARVREALRRRGVVLIRDAHLDDAAQVNFSRKLGTVLAAGGKEIFTVSLDPAKSRSAEYLKGTFEWHIDDTGHAVPAKFTMLTARQVAMVGGDTEFANTYAAYEDLPESRRRRYEGLRVVHSLQASQRRVHPDPSDEQLAAWRSVGAREMSLIWQRRDGRRSMVLGATADHIVGMERAASDALLAELEAWATQERFRYRHEWAVGDVVIWDNTGMLHRALPYAPSSERTLHRTTIAGDEAWT